MLPLAIRMGDAVGHLAASWSTDMTDYRLLPGLPAYGEIPRSFPASWGRLGSEGVAVAFEPRSGGAWTGNFAPGMGGVSDVQPHPDRRRVLVFAAGDAWEVDAETRSAELVLEGVMALWPVDAPNGLVVDQDGLSFARLGPGGVVWRTRRLSWDGFSSVQVGDGGIRGVAWDAVSDGWLPFEVDLATGESRGGSFGEDDLEGWERLAQPPADG
jgi:hypothetical protein